MLVVIIAGTVVVRVVLVPDFLVFGFFGFLAVFFMIGLVLIVGFMRCLMLFF